MSLSEKTPEPKYDNSPSSDNGEIGQSSQLDPLNLKQTKRHLLPRHIQLIAISGAIGTGLFVSVSDQSES